MSFFSINYRFMVSGSDPYEYQIVLDKRDGTIKDTQAGPSSLPEWSRLTYHQCPNCPLSALETAHCPVAVRLPPLMAIAEGLQSHDRLTLEVETEGRAVWLETSAQRAMSSLLGLVMAASGCPHTAYLRPMARFHLPLASEEETVYRAATMYLLAQHFLHRRGLAVDLDLTGLGEIYQELHRVNAALAERIRAASIQDTAANAVVLLDLLAKGVPYSIDEVLDELQGLFAPYLDAVRTA